MITLDDVASADFIARMDPAYRAELRATLAAVTPSTLVGDGRTGPLTMAELAKVHQDSVGVGERRMGRKRAWGYAVSDLVFGGFTVCAEQGPQCVICREPVDDHTAAQNAACQAGIRSVREYEA